MGTPVLPPAPDSAPLPRVHDHDDAEQLDLCWAIGLPSW